MKKSLEKKGKTLALDKCSQAFLKIMQNYKNNKYIPSEQISIETLLTDFRSEKIKRLSNEEVILEELGEEIAKYKEESFFKGKTIKVIKPKKRESKVDFLSSLNLTNKNKMLRLPPLSISKKDNIDQRYYPQSKNKMKEFSLNILFQKKIYKSHKERQTRLYQTTVKNQNQTISAKIDSIANDIEYDTKIIQETNVRHLINFQEKFDDWKRTQEFTFPELKKSNQIKNAVK